jgi:MFS family permease
VIGRYRSLLATPGALGFVVPGFLGRLPAAMRPLGCVLLVSGLTGSYSLADAASAALTVAQAAAGPRLGRIADRHGQRLVLLLALAAHSTGICALVFAAQLRAPAWVLLCAAALAGASVAPVGSMVRSRWSTLVGNEDGFVLNRAYALESVLDEVVFVCGPVLVSALALGLFPAAGLRVIVFTIVGCGTIVGSVEIALVAFAKERGSPGAAGVLISLFAVGSLVAALAYGARDWRAPPRRRFAFAVAWLLLGTVPILLSGTIPLMALSVTLAGIIAQAPAAIAASTLVAALVPRSSITEGFAWLSTATVVGIAIGASSAGRMVDLYGARPALLVAFAGGTVALLTVTAGWRYLGREK